MKKHISISLIALLVFVSNAHATNSISFTKPLNYGTQNSDIIRLQQFLSDKGYLTVKPTGYYGVLTVKAVEAFQIARGIGQPYGKRVGPLTLGFLNREFGGVGGVPAVTTSDASAITTNSAMLRGMIAMNPDGPNVGDYAFFYGRTTLYGSTARAIPGSGGYMSASVTGLTCGTLYHYTLTATIDTTTSTGGDMTFTTNPCS